MILDEKLTAAIAAQESGRGQDAEKLYWDILRERPKDPIAMYQLGVISFNRADYKMAADLLKKSLAIYKNTPSGFNALGLALAGLGKRDEAIAAYREAITLEPQNHDAYNNLAIMLLDKDDFDQAIKICRQAIAQKPDSFLTYYNLGVALQRQGKTVEAVDSFKKAVAIFPAFPEAYCNLGLALMGLGKREAAIDAYRQALKIRPDFPEALNNLGQPLSDLGKYEEAADVYQKAATLRPQYTDVFINLAHTLRRLGRLGDAIEACRKGLAANPDNIKAQIELGNLRRLACDWRDVDADIHRMYAVLRYVEPFLLLSVPSSPAEQLTCAQSWTQEMPRGVPFINDRYRQSSKIRIGYLSCDFHMHATAFLMAELFERHDRSRFELFAYSYDRDDKSDIRRRVIKAFDHFIDIHDMSDAEAAQRIHRDGIDILVDLKGYTQGTRTGILINRPAPVQVNYVGYPGTMGADFIDYVIGDPVVTPMNHQRFYTEKIAQLPHCYQPNDSKRQIADHTPSRADCGLPEKAFVFCCFNASFKLTQPFFEIWMRLLKAVPGSVLWLISMATPEVEVNLKREAAVRGVKPQRLVFAGPLHLPSHLARHRQADMFLDTLPYGAHTTASDALWAGLPVLTCTGPTFAGRVGSSACHAIGLPEMVTASLPEYEARALELATNPAMLAQIKEKLAKNRTTTPMFDIVSYTRGLEAAYTRMFETWRAGKPAAPFTVDKV